MTAIKKSKEHDRKWCHHAYQLIWLHSITVSWDGIFSLGPQFGAQVTMKVGMKVRTCWIAAWRVGSFCPHRLNNTSSVIWSFKGRLMIRYILISEVRLVPGRVIHVLQNSPDNPLQLFPRSLLLLQRPPHPLVVLKERDKERSGRVRERKTSRRVERCIEYWALNRKYWTDRTFKRGNSNLFYHLSLVQKYHNNNCLISTLIMSFS